MSGTYLIANVSMFVYLAMALAALGIELWAFADALRHSPDKYDAAMKRTKGFWLLITGVAAAVGLLSLLGGGGMGLFGFAAVIAAGVYLADVRPAIANLRGGSSAW